jgi:hypothetical protein
MEWLTEHDRVTGEEYIAVDTRGEALLCDPLTNKGTAFTEGERADLGLDGLVPPAVSTVDPASRQPRRHKPGSLITPVVDERDRSG